MLVVNKDLHDQFKFFGEYALYPEGNEKEKKEAKLYLELWRKFLIIKLFSELRDYEFLDEQWIDRAAIYQGPLCTTASLGLKIAYKSKLPHEISDGTSYNTR